MKTTLLKSIGIALSIILPLAAQAKTSVWEVTNGENKVYIGGTVHLLPANAFPLPKEFNLAYKAADKLAFEADMSLMQSLPVQQQLQARMFLSDNKTIDQIINQKAYDALKQYASKNGMPLASIERFKPSMLSVVIAMTEMQKMGISGEGVDAFYDKMAQNDGKERLFLESVDFQIDMLFSMGKGQESELILMTLEQVDDYKVMFGKILKGWREGNSKLIEEAVINPAKEQSTELYNDIFIKRNRNWISHIDKMLTDKPIELILVGAGHLYGDDSVIDLLRKKGYQVKQLDIAN